MSPYPREGITIVVTGSRSWNRIRLIHQTLAEFRDYDVRLVTGGARGADALAFRVGAEFRWVQRVIPADWDRYGLAAGPVRNLQLLDEHPDVVLAFWDGMSSGTRHCFTEARRRGVYTRVIQP